MSAASRRISSSGDSRTPDEPSAVGRLKLSTRAPSCVRLRRSIEIGGRAPYRAASRSDSVPDPEFVEDVRIRSREIRDGILAEHQALEERLVDDPANSLFVSPYRI